MLACGLVAIGAKSVSDDLGLQSLQNREWRPADVEQIQCAIQGLRRIDDPFGASILQEVVRYRQIEQESSVSTRQRECEAAIVAALLGGPAARNAAMRSMDGLRVEEGGARPSFKVSSFHIETGAGTTLVVGGPEGSSERLGILVTDSLQLSIDERNKQLNWMHPGILQFHLGLDRAVWPLPIAADDCATFRSTYTWEIARLEEREAWLFRLCRADRPGLELYLRVHGDRVSIPLGAALVRDGGLQKAGVLTWGCASENSAAIIPQSYIGFVHHGDTTALERWTIRDVSLGFRPEDIRLQVPEGLVLWDLRTQAQRRFGEDPVSWPSAVLERVWHAGSRR
jgi:hypothetical protein